MRGTQECLAGGHIWVISQPGTWYYEWDNCESRSSAIIQQGCVPGPWRGKPMSKTTAGIGSSSARSWDGFRSTEHETCLSSREPEAPSFFENITLVFLGSYLILKEIKIKMHEMLTSPRLNEPWWTTYEKNNAGDSSPLYFFLYQ